MASFSEPGLPAHIFLLLFLELCICLTIVVLVCRRPCLTLWMVLSAAHPAARCGSVFMVDLRLLNVCVAVRVCSIHSCFGEQLGCSQQFLLCMRFS